LSREKVDAAFVYFGRVDEVGHDLNPLSPQYTSAIEAMDKQVGQVVQAIRSRATYAQEDWLILMSTDHGHVDKGGHGGPSKVERNIFVLANGPNVAHQTLPDDTEIVDVGVTALAHLGVAIDPRVVNGRQGSGLEKAYQRAVIGLLKPFTCPELVSVYNVEVWSIHPKGTRKDLMADHNKAGLNRSSRKSGV
jgi:hypothetical protein